ncbi:hypothetical protein AVEN_246143-1 [Araneus ventricosus]|uniref:Uncharacterized protein n=1 Tax=Araneus ventricosus TaxID=182803 RepID=A0A4Y2R9C1_ARAVE|nr:hypothetical protein AVEN_246143-1 [Araneus ventricosus]
MFAWSFNLAFLHRNKKDFCEDMDDKLLDLSKEAPIESVKEDEPLNPTIYVSSHGELSKPVEERRWATEQVCMKSVPSHQINREKKEENLEGAAKDEKGMNFVDRFSSYTYGRSGHVQDGEKNLEPYSLKSNQLCTAIRVSLVKSPIKNKRNIVKDESSATDGPAVKTFSPRGESSQLLESGRKATKGESMKSVYAHKLCKENETLVSGDMIPGSYVMNKKKTSKVPATISRTKRHKTFDSASDVKHKSKARIFDEGCRQRATARCSCSRPSTSACCSYDSPVIQGHPMNSDQELPLFCERFRHSNNVEEHSKCEQCTKRLSRSDGLQVQMDT